MKNLVIFGAGKIGGKLLEIIGDENVLCFADNFPKSDFYLGFPLIGFDALKKLYQENQNLLIIIASYDYCSEISLKLVNHGMLRYYIWPRMGSGIFDINRELYKNIYAHKKLLEYHGADKCKSIALYAYNHSLESTFNLLFQCGCLDKIKYVIRQGDDGEKVALENFMTECDNLDAIKDDIDLLLLGVGRKDSKLHDLVECNQMPFAVVDLRRFEGLLPNTQIVQFKDKHKGERCFIIGNGPSLKMSDLDLLSKNKEICFGCNRIYLAFDETMWRPDYYLAVDKFTLEQSAKEIYQMDVPYKFIDGNRYHFWKSDFSKGAIKFNIPKETFVPNMPGFSKDFSAYSSDGTTVTYSCIQLAAYMGFKEMYLLGVDFDYSGDMSKSENHFTKKYIGKNDNWFPFFPESPFLAYKKAELFSRAHNFRVYNATRGGKLEVFERVDFDKLF